MPPPPMLPPPAASSSGSKCGSGILPARGGPGHLWRPWPGWPRRPLTSPARPASPSGCTTGGPGDLWLAAASGGGPMIADPSPRLSIRADPPALGLTLDRPVRAPASTTAVIVAPLRGWRRALGTLVLEDAARRELSDGEVLELAQSRRPSSVGGDRKHPAARRGRSPAPAVARRLRFAGRSGHRDRHRRRVVQINDASPGVGCRPQPTIRLASRWPR